MNSDEEQGTVNSIPISTNTDTVDTGMPSFNHPEINLLYVNGMQIDHEIIKKILELPRESLIADLEKVIADFIVRQEFFSSKDWDEHEDKFPLHATFLLIELKSEQSLQKVLNVLRLDEDFLDFWFGDFLGETIWEAIFVLGQNKLEELKQYMFEKNLYCFARCEVPAALSQLVLHYPEKRNEVVNWFNDVFDFFLKNKENTDLIDDTLIGLMVCDILDFEGKELEGILKIVFENFNISDRLFPMEWEQFKKQLYNPAFLYTRKRKSFSIYERYNNIVSTWHGYKEEEEEEDNDEWEDTDYSDTISPPPTTKKIGRNDPCPCGSGKI